ncbi:ATP-binding protein [Ancylobacter defluvii]|uniref:Sensor histidine kinase n=1 Tax=Ancylobacter defluvii TaxID=1282440 RepID=A0A9W6JZL2_9HYPH|nr:ATP-binding protein [Ancylobacter defluvii]MBS7586754.1 HAMP domain-containing protein [Ancylobacter defluvii]GLK86057.1 sensor histidine kinase [Ancylobacter defluvii]
MTTFASDSVAGAVDYSFWGRRSLRWQVMAAVIVINLCAALVAFVVVILNAQRATRLEMLSSVAIAERLVQETAERLAETVGGSVSLTQLPLHITGLRHVRIHIEDLSGKIIAEAPSASDAGGEDETDEVPGWFADLVTVDRAETAIPVVENGKTVGVVRISGEASDEIAEVWSDMSDLALLAAAVNITILAALYLVLGRLLQPLQTLSTGLHELEEGRFDHRLPLPRVRELARIVDRFNALSAALRMARQDNLRLNERLVRVQDDERRQIAADLHDELGPCLFGLRANLESIGRVLGRLESDPARRIGERVATMSEILDRVQEGNRSLLRRIRPMALGHVPLAAVIAELLADFERHSPDRQFRLSLENVAEHYGDSIEITVYRCVQEAVTNALRHGQASRIAVSLREEAAGVCLRLAVEDDGLGLQPDSTPGFGLIGIEERIGALGGGWHLAPVAPRGMRIEITLPVRPDNAAPASNERAKTS